MKLLKKYREIIIYLIVGVITTIVSWGACYVAKFFLDSNVEFQNFIINTIGWVVGVLVAYPLNRIWVFQSKSRQIFKEFFGFALSRVSTWIMDIVIMFVFVNVIPLNDLIINVSAKFGKTFEPATVDTINYWIAKICISAVIVTILNYVFSKVFIFKKKKPEKIEDSRRDE